MPYDALFSDNDTAQKRYSSMFANLPQQESPEASINKPLATEAKPQRGVLSDLATHYAIGANKYLAMPLAGVTEMVGRATGIKPVEEFGKDIGDNAEKWIAQQEQESPSQKFQDIGSAGDAARWAGQQLAEFAPQAVVTLATGGAGGAAGRALAGTASRTGLVTAERLAGEKAIQTAAANTGRALTADELGLLAAKRAGEAGAIAATGAGSIGMETSSIFRDQQPEQKDMGKALLYGTAAGILDTAFPAWLMKKTGLTRLMPGMGKAADEAEALLGAKPALSLGQRAKDVAKIAGLGVGEESLQEGVQTVLENIGANKPVYSDEVKQAGDDFSAFLKVASDKGIRAAVNPNAWSDIVESMAAGGLIGGVMGGGSSAAGHVVDVRQQKLAGTPAAPLATGPATDNIQPTTVNQQPSTDLFTERAQNEQAGNALSKALNSGGISVAQDTTPLAGTDNRQPTTGNRVSASMYTDFASTPFANAPADIQPVPNAGPQVSGLLDGIKPRTELDAARDYNYSLRDAGKLSLMQNVGTSEEQFNNNLLTQYRRAKEAQNGAASILPQMPGQGPSQVDRLAVAMPNLQTGLGGVGSNNSQPEGLANGLPGAQPAPIPLLTSPLKGEERVQSSDVADPRITALEQQKAAILADPRNRGIAGDTVYTKSATDQLGAINAEIQAIQQQAKPDTVQDIPTAPAAPAAVTSLDNQAHEAASSPHNDTPLPSLAQIEAGNYAKGHVNLHGLDISIENPAGSVRKGVDETGRQWQTDLAHHYGYIKGTVGKDKDHIDVFIKPGVEQATAGDRVFVVDQKNTKTGQFDEHKVMLGFGSAQEARKAYLANYDKSGPQRILNVAESTVPQFKQWLKNGNTNKPFASNPAPATLNQQPTTTNRQLDSSTDSLIVAAAKLGGISRSDIDQQMGNGGELARTLNTMAGKQARSFMHVISSKGVPLDTMRERLVENGYLPEGATINDLLDRLDGAQRDSHTYSTANSGTAAEADYDAEVARIAEQYAELAPEEIQEDLQALDDAAEKLADGEITQEVMDEALSFFDQFIAADNGQAETDSSQTAAPETPAVSAGDAQAVPAENTSAPETARNSAAEAGGTAAQGNLADAERVARTVHGADGQTETTVPEPIQIELPAGIYQTKVKDHDGTISEMYGVRKQEQDVRGSNFGDTLHHTLDEAIAAQKEQAEAHKDKQERLAKQAEKDAAEKAANEKAQAERDNIDGFASDKPAIQRGKIVDTLNKVMRFDGVEKRLKEQIRSLVADGYTVVESKWGRVLQHPSDGSFYEQKTITKTGLDYAEYLQGKAPAVSAGDAQAVSAEDAGQDGGTGGNEVGDFGPILRQFRHDAQGAISALKELQNGEAIAALHHPEVGDIDLVWGVAGNSKSDGYGLAKLVKFHPDVLNDLQNILLDMQVVKKTANRINLESERYQASVRLEWNGEKKQWLLTAFEKRSGDKTTTDTLAVTGTDDTASRSTKPLSDNIIPPTTENVKENKQPAAAPTAASTTDVSDVGENLWYNRRNHTGRGIAWDDISSLNDTLKVKEVVKAKVWPRPDYEQLVADGLNPLFARILKNIYDGIAAKPAGTGDEQLQRYITAVNRVRDDVLAWMNDAESQREYADSVAAMAGRELRLNSGVAVNLSEMMQKDDFTKAFLERIWPEEMRKPSYVRFSRGSEALAEVQTLGGNKALKALQIDKQDVVKFMKEIAAGWPAQREAWQVQGYSVHASVDYPLDHRRRYVTDANNEYVKDASGNRATKSVYYTPVGRFDDSGEARRALTAKGVFLLLDKAGRVRGGYDTKEAAENAARDLVKREGRGGRDLRGMNITEAERKGPERRGVDENISSQRFMETFGFKGVNFGRVGYINEAERQQYLNHAYDALHDLAEILGVPVKALSLNGELGIAFGAQGRGGHAAAHFVPGHNEINMTKTMGAGTLAHEWGHALDHYFGVMSGFGKNDHPYLSEYGHRPVGTDIRPEIAEAFQRIVKTMEKRPMTEAEWRTQQAARKINDNKHLDSWLAYARKQLERDAKGDKQQALAEYDALAARIKAGDVGEGFVKSGNKAFRPTVAALRNLFKDATGRLLDQQTTSNINSWSRLQKNDSEAIAATPEHLPQVKTDYARESAAKDKEKQGKQYWSTSREMFARAFELFVHDRLAEAEQVNTFLSDAALRAETRNLDDNSYASPYPRGLERETINSAFRELVGGIKTRETEKSVALYSVAEAAPAPSSPAFRQWFGSSRVVDQAGKPLLVYHGTESAGFSEFDRSRIASKGGGFWFTTLPDLARGHGKNIMPGYLRLENPASYEQMIDLERGAPSGMTRQQKADYVMAQLKRQGYDGVMMQDGSDGIYIVFDPNQIKSAGNNGQWSRQSNNINMSAAEQTAPAGVPHADLQRLVVAADKLSGVRLVAVADNSQLPAGIRADMKQRGITRPEGVTWQENGKTTIYYVAANINGMERMQALLRHEWFHAGVADKELDALYKYYSGKDLSRLERIAEQRDFDLTSQEGRRQAAGELAAQEAEKGKLNLYVRQIMAKVKAWLRALGADVAFGDAEVADIIRTAISRVTEQQGTGGYLVDPAYAKTKLGLAKPDDTAIINSNKEGDYIDSTSSERILSGAPETGAGEPGKIQSLRDRLKESGTTGPVYSKALRSQQDQIAREWANTNHLPIKPESDFLDIWDKTSKIKGGENRVYFQDNYAYKLNNLIYHDSNLQDFADRLIQSNRYFPDVAIDIIGFAETPQGLRPLLRQETVVVQRDTVAADRDIRQELERMGFQLLDADNDIWLSPDKQYFVTDTGSNNVLLDEQGVLRFIDVLFHKVTQQRIDRLVPGLKIEQNGTAHYSLADQGIAAQASIINAPTKVATMTKDLMDMAGKMIPERLKANIGKVMSNPWFGSEGKPIRREVVNLNLARSQNRNSIISDLFQAAEGYSGVEGLDNILKEATPEERKQFNELVKYSDLNGVGKTFTRDELYRGKTQFGKLSRNVVEAYKAFHEVMQAANRVRFEQLDQMALLPYADQPWYDDLVAVLNRNQERMAALSTQESGDFYRLARSMKRDLTDEQLSGGDNPAKIKATPAVIEAYRDFWKQVEGVEKKHQGNLLSAFRDILFARSEIAKMKDEWGHLGGYAPRNRKDGEWHVSVYVTEEDGSERKVYMKPTRTEFGAMRLLEKVQQDLPGHLKGNYQQGEQYRVAYERNTATPGELLQWKGSEIAVENLLNKAFDRAGITGKMSTEQWAGLKHEVFQEIAKEIMAQGFGRHGIAREKTQIEGYEDTDYQAVLKEYISGMSGWLSKMRFAIETTREANKISQADPMDKVWVNDYVQDAMKNSTYLDELAAQARSVGAIYYLGFKVSSAVLNAFQNYTVGQAELAMMMKKAGLKKSAVLLLGQAQKDVLKDFVERKRSGQGTLSDEEHEVLRRAVREGTAQAQNVRMMSGSQEMGFSTGWKKFTELAMTPFQFVEQNINREPAILAAYRAFKSTPAGEFDATAYKKGEDLVNNVHYVMGKENLPELVRKLGPVGKTAYLFQGFAHNYFHWLFNRARQGEFETIARSFGAIAALGGVFALPGADDMDKWLLKWYGKSYKLAFKKWLRNNVGNQTVEDFVNHGVTSVAGVNMSRALAVNIPFISDPEKTAGERLGGVWGGMFKKPGQAMSAAQKGDYLRAVENMLPEFAANPMRAVRQYNQGATTMAGKPIFDPETGKQMRYGALDVAKKAMGFNPLEISQATELKGAERELMSYWNDRRNDTLAEIRRAKNGREITELMHEFNTALKASQAIGPVRTITTMTARKARQHSKPDKLRSAWERQQLGT